MNREYPTFAVVTPTFNRAHTLVNLFNSLVDQTYKKFTWYIVDDGSTDSTPQLVQLFKKKANFEIRYYKKVNTGKVRSLNYVVQYVNEDLFLVCDSDDTCTPDALERFASVWRNRDLSLNFGAMSALKGYQNGTIVGDDYANIQDGTYLERMDRQVKGDKWECLLTDCVKKYPYLEVANEKYLAPSYQWLMLGREYKTRYINEILCVVEYLEDGISKNNIRHRSQSPLGCIAMYSLIFELTSNSMLRIRAAINIIRFMCHSGKIPDFKTIKRLNLHISHAIIAGIILYLFDVYKLKYR